MTWRAGVPEISLAAAGSRGQKWEMSAGTAYAFREDFTPGQVYTYRFDTGEIKGSLRQAALAAGCGWRGVAFGRF